MPFSGIPKEDARIEKTNGNVVGPYKAIFAGDTIMVVDAEADVEEGDTVLRRLPSGRDERSRVTDATFISAMMDIPAHYQLKFQKAGTAESKAVGNTFNIHGGQIQIGDHNTQNIINALQELKGKIDSADAPPEQKLQARALLSSLLAHPLVTSVLGGLAGGV